MKTDIYSHFRPEERPFIDRANEWLQRAERAHEVRRTDFLDPRQQFIVQSLANRHRDIQLMFDGGYVEAERKRAWIAPDYLQLEEEERGILVLAITSDDAKATSLEHGDYMGAILGLGLKRDKVGDIHVSEQGCHCLAASETIEYLDLHLRQVNRVNVRTDILPLEQFHYVAPQLQEVTYTVSSLRLDAIAGDAVRVSRSKILEPIRSGNCRVNWKVEIDPATLLHEGDIISLRGFGRFKLLEIGGKSKKDRIHIKVGKYI